MWTGRQLAMSVDWLHRQDGVWTGYTEG